MSVIKVLRDLDGLFNYSTDENPTSQQDYQEAVKNWVKTIVSLVDAVMWQPETEYTVGSQLLTPSLPHYVLRCTVAGTSGAAEPDYTDVALGDEITDGTVTWVVDGYLPLSGGTMSGAIKWSGTDFTAIKRDNGNDGLCIIGGDTDNFSGATLQLFGQTNGSYAGRFCLRASTRSAVSDTSHPTIDLTGNPNGSLTWNGKEVERVNAKGTKYIRYEDGLQICWGEISVTGGNAHSSATCTLPVSFGNTSYIITVGGAWVASTSECFRIESKATTKFIYSIVTPSSNNHAWFFIAVGWWK